ncbi:prolyl oligopeptidase family serine peptidase, partial [Idiomarina xiamenensis]
EASAAADEQQQQYQLRVINTQNQSQLTLASDLAEVIDLRFADDGKQLAALVKMSAKDADNQDDYRVLYWRYGQQQALAISPRIKQAGQTLVVSKNSLPRFSKNSGQQTRLFFGLQPQPSNVATNNEKSDDIYDVEALLAKRELQVWHADDARIKPQEKLTYKDRQQQTVSGVYWVDDERYQLLASKRSDDLNISENRHAALLQDSDPYLQEMTWDGFYHDLYWVDLNNGKRQLVTSRLSSYFDRSLSPSGRYVAWYSDNQLHIYDSRRQQQSDVVAPEGISWADEDHDYPRPASGYGIAGWLADDAGFITYDKYDVWQITPAGKAINLTQGQGRQQQLQYRLVDTQPERLTLSDTPLLRAYSTSDKHFGFYRLEVDQRALSQLIEKNKKYDFVKAAKDADVLLFSEQDFQQFPDLWVTDHRFAQPHQVTDLNPQIDQFAWGSSELVEWTSSNGEPLQGVLIKPANYEPGKRYPVLVYYYRFFSQRLYEFNEMKVNHRPNFPFYTSNGYAVFLPDVKFTVGEPGASATQALVPGVQKLVDMGVADPDAIGLHGHSWSGYQTAFVITQTDIFKAAVAGAPVTNMTSAYSGIRWGSGLARQFQYEQTQSRIGKTLYEAPQLYIENSPVFYADRINTPLVIEFGDEDGAVPWEQGIELYLALRRLHKPVVMLQYEGEPHHLKKYPNKVDYTLKMKAFFDHYLKGEAAPKWWQEGEAYSE